MLSVKRGGIKYPFLGGILVWLKLGLKPGLLDHLTNTLTIMPKSGRLIKGYSKLLRTLESEPHRRMQFNVISRNSPVGWGCKIRRRHLCRGIRPFKTSILDMTLNRIWLCSSSPSLPLLSGPLWPGVVIIVFFPFLDQIKLISHFVYMNPVNYAQTIYCNTWKHWTRSKQ